MIKTQLIAIKWLILNIGFFKIIQILVEILIKKPKNHLITFNFQKNKIKMQICSERTDLAMLTEIFCFQAYEIKRKINPKFIIDGGANKGSATIYFGIKYPNSFIHCYEPNIDLIPILKNNIKLNNINAKVYNKALSNKKGKLFLEKYSNHQYSKLTNNNTGVIVNTIKIDEKYINKNIDILKLDIEGEEYKVLKSLKLNNISLIIQEIHYDRVDFNKIKSKLLKKGYKIEPSYPQYKFLNANQKYPILISYKQ